MRELERSMSSLELTEWMAYFKLEAEERKRALLDAKAQAGVASRRRAPRRRR